MKHSLLKKLGLIALVLFALFVLPRAHASLFDSIDSVEIIQKKADAQAANKNAADAGRSPASTKANSDADADGTDAKTPASEK